MPKNLLFFRSRSIVEFCIKHPVNQRGQEQHLANLGGIGDIMPPVPVMESFLSLLHTKATLFTQKELYDAIVQEPDNQSNQWLVNKKFWWDYSNLTTEQLYGFRVKTDRNFYSSFIDSLHIFSMCSEHQEFDVCKLDSADDATSKTDITLIQGNRSIKLALQADTKKNREYRAYKDVHRGRAPKEAKIAWLNMKWEIIGGKRWYPWNYIHDVIYDVRYLPSHLERISERNGWTFPVPRREGFSVETTLEAEIKNLTA